MDGAAEEEQLGALLGDPYCAAEPKLEGAAELKDWMSRMLFTRSPNASAHSAISLHLDLWLALLSHHACICVGGGQVDSYGVEGL